MSASVKPYPWDTADYWDGLARNERAFAKEDRRRRYGTVESIKLHLQNAADYEAKAAAIRAQEDR